MLGNGVKVISYSTPSPLTTTVAVGIDSGSRDDPHELCGVSNYFSKMFVQSTEQRPTIVRVIRDMEWEGITVEGQAQRENMVFKATSTSDKSEEATAMLSDFLRSPKMYGWEVSDRKEAYLQGLSGAHSHDLNVMLDESMHNAAFGNNGLGKYQGGNKAGIEAAATTDDAVKDWLVSNLHPKKVVVSGVGIEHEHLHKLAEQHWGDLAAKSETSERSASQYVGGDLRAPMDSEMVKAAVAFKGPGLKSDQYATLCVLNTLMGGGSAFSAGGPGKGLYSRLYRNVLNRHGWMESAETFISMNTDVSLFGVSGLAPGQAGMSLVQVLVDQLMQMSTITEEEVDRAKNQLKTQYLINVETPTVLVEELSKAAMYDTVKTVPETVASISSVTHEQVKALVKEMLTGSEPTFAAVGSVADTPPYFLVQRALKGGQ